MSDIIYQQSAYIAIVATLLLTLYKQAPSKFTFWDTLRSYGIMILLILIFILQTQGQLNQINKTTEMKLKINHLEKILQDNNLTVRNPNDQVEYESKMDSIDKAKKIKLFPFL